MTTAEPIRFLRPELPPAEEIAAYFERSRKTHWFSNGGPCHELLVERVRAYLGVPGCVPVANGTLGLVLALRALTSGRSPGADLVVLPAFTFVATAAAVEWCGLRPLFADVDSEGWHLDVGSLEEAMSRHRGRIAAILACSTFGTPPEEAVTRSWEEQAARAGVPLLVDSASGFGAGHEGGRLGSQGDAEVFSWHATKPFAIGEGGLVSTRSIAVAEHVRRLSNFGFDDERRIGAGLGLNAKLDEWHAATGLAALDRIDSVIDARRRVARTVIEQLEPLGYRAQARSHLGAWQFIPLLAPTPDVRRAALEACTSEAIEVRSYFDLPLHWIPSLRGAERVPSLAVTEDLASRCLSLPMANDLADESIERTVSALRSAVGPGA